MRRFNWIYLAFLFFAAAAGAAVSVYLFFVRHVVCAIYVIAAVRLFHYVFFILFYFIVLDTLFAFHSNKIIHIYLIIGCECVVFVFVFFASFKYKWYDVDWFTGRDFFCCWKTDNFSAMEMCVCVCVWCVSMLFYWYRLLNLRKCPKPKGNNIQWHISVGSCGFSGEMISTFANICCYYYCWCWY